MNKSFISATDLKENISSVLNEVLFKSSLIIIKRHGKPVAKIVPIDENESEPEKNLIPKVDYYFGILKNFPDVTKDRHFRKRDINLDK